LVETAYGVVNLNDVTPLQTLLNLAELRGELTNLCQSRNAGWGGLEEVRVRILRLHRARQCTFAVALKTETGTHDLIGKVYLGDRVEVFEIMEKLWRAGFHAEAEYSIPQPVAYVPSMRLRFEERVEGRSVEEVLVEDGLSEQLAAAQRCGSWLAQFHTTAPRLGKATVLREELASAERWALRLASLGEPFAGKAEAVFQKLVAAASALAPMELRAAHGSYQPSHVILAEGRTVTIDWDNFVLADPSRDVAWFLVKLQRLALERLGDHHALESVAETFLWNYVCSGPWEVLARLPVYQALFYMEAAKRDLKSQLPQWREQVGIMLDQALRVLSAPAMDQESSLLLTPIQRRGDSYSREN